MEENVNDMMKCSKFRQNNNVKFVKYITKKMCLTL